MDFDLDDLISTDAANNAKTSTKFQPKTKPKPKPKLKPKTQLESKSEAIPLKQVVEDVAAANNEFTARIGEEQPGNDVNQISGNINDDWQSSFEKSPEANVESFLTLESLNDFPSQSTRVTVNSPPCSETPTVHVSMDGNLEKGPMEPDLSNNIDACTNFGSLAQLDPLTGEEAAIFNDNGDFQIGNLSGSKDNESSPFWESLDILSHTCSGPRVGKFKPKPKAQTRKLEQIATTPDKDLASVQYEENVDSAPSQTNYMENKAVPSFTADDILGSSSMRVTDSAPTETIFDFHVNEESMNLADQMDSVIPEEHLDAVTESLSAGPESVKKGKRKTRKGLSPTQLDKSSESNLDQVGTASERLRRRSNKTLELIDESEDEGIDDGFVHGNEDNSDYEPGNESLGERKGSKSKKPVNEKEKPVRKRKKASDVPVESTKVAKKKFPHRTRRNKRQVNPELLKMTEDELEMHMHNVPMKELIRLAEHRERIAKKDASTSGTPAMNQSASSFSNHYDEDEAFAQGTGSAYEHDYSMEAENATYYNYRTHMKITPRIKWSKQDTELFYEAIQQFGTDLSMIKECFPGRTREQIKAKYKKEERQQPLRLSDALTTRAKGHSQFEVVLERLKQAEAQDSENDDPINLTGEEDEDVTATDINADLDATKPVELQKEVKEMEKADNTKLDDSEDEIDWSQYKSEI